MKTTCNKSWLLLIRGVLMLLLTQIQVAVGAQIVGDDYANAARQLFPRTRNWHELVRMPWLSDTERVGLWESLRRAHGLGVGAQPAWTSSCDLMERLRDPLNKERLHRADINNDGKEDIVYVGDAFCDGEVSTLIWVKDGDGYQLQLPTYRGVELILVSTERVSGNGGVDTLSVRSDTCCKRESIAYFLGSATNLSRSELTTMHRDTVLPTVGAINPRRFTTEVEVEVYLSPFSGAGVRSTGDSPAVVARRFAAGVSGALMAVTEVDGDAWGFVTLAPTAERNAMSTPSGTIRSGWVRVDGTIKFQ